MRRRLAVAATVASSALLVLAAPAQAEPSFLHADLTGAAEVPGPGDPDGGGTAFVVALPDQGKVCFTLFVHGIGTANGAHIHEAPADEAGPVVVTLEPPASGGSGGCGDTAEAADIATQPEDYYVNVHNAEFPGGAVRGQLS
jgi:hypothetical protein